MKIFLEFSSQFFLMFEINYFMHKYVPDFLPSYYKLVVSASTPLKLTFLECLHYVYCYKSKHDKFVLTNILESMSK